MAKYKAALMILMRKLLQERGAETEKAFLAQLQPEEATIYQTAMPITWIPIAPYARIITLGAKALYPDDPKPVRRLGREEASDNLRGVYRTLMSFVSVKAMIDQTPRLWRYYHDQGMLKIDHQEAKHEVTFTLEGYPELPDANLEVLAGFLTQVIEMANKQNVKVVVDNSNPQAWTWRLSYS